ENDLVQATAHQPGARAWYVVDEAALAERVRGRTVAELVEAAPTRVDPPGLPFPAPPGAVAAVRVKPGITHTIGGLRVDPHARAVLVRLPDLPRGWRVRPIGGTFRVDDIAFTCDGFSPDLSSLTANGGATEVLWVPKRRQLSQFAVVFAAPREATTFFSRDVDPFIGRCAEKSVGKSTAAGKVLSVRRLELGLGANSLAYRSVL